MLKKGNSKYVSIKFYGINTVKENLNSGSRKNINSMFINAVILNVP